MGTQERKARERLNRENMILDAAERVFFSRGFDQSTMDDVAEEVELSKGSLYNYFKNKNELCIGIVSRSLCLLIQYLEEAVGGKLSGIDKFYSFAKAFQVFRQENPEYYCALQSSRQHSCGCGDESKFLNMTNDGNRKINEILISLIRQGITDGSIQGAVQPDKAANALWGEFNGILPGMDLNSTESGYEYAIELIINGLKK